MKQFFFFLCLFMLISTFNSNYAQIQSAKAVLKADFPVLQNRTDPQSLNAPQQVFTRPFVTTDSGAKLLTGISKTHIGTSANVYSVYMSEQTCLTANEETGLIMMTHRADGTTLGSGVVQCSFSVDSGKTFNNSSVVIWNDIYYPGRYPGGVIYNPTGNTNPANAFAVAAGPVVNNGSWAGGFFASERMDGTLNNSQTTLFTTDTAGGAGQLNEFPRMFMQSRGNKFFIYGSHNVLNTAQTAYTNISTTINLGTWNTGLNRIDWTRVAHTPDYTTTSAGVLAGDAYPGYVMADDGLNGYLIYTGRDILATDTLSYIPMIYKTTNGGLSWVKQAAFDWTAIPVVQSFSNEYSTALRPNFDNISDAVIDANGRLHFTCFIRGAASNHIDSLNYINVYSGLKGFVFDTYQTATGWNAVIVDTIFAMDADVDNTIIDPGTSNAVVMDDRFQMSRTQDGSKIFYAWLDTDPTYTEFNIYPDIFIKMYDVASGTMGPTINLTKGTSYDAFNYWLCLSDIAFDMDSVYQLHISTSTLNTSASGPVDHEYINNVYLDESGNLLTVPAAPTTTSVIHYCVNDVATPLTATGNNLRWYTTPTGGTGSSTAPTPNTATAGTQTFYVSQTVNGLESARTQITVTVQAIPTESWTATNISKCPGTAITLTSQSSPQPDFTYTWSGPDATGHTTNVISVTSAGIYGVTVTGACTTVNDQIEVIDYSAPVPSLGPDVIICDGNTVTLNPGSFTGYAWSTSASAPTINVTMNGTYRVTVTDGNGCQASDAINITVLYPPDLSICFVEFDTISLKNRIQWAIPPANAESISIYSEISTNIFSLIGTVPATQTSYIDMTSNPQNMSNSYKISVSDTCSNEGNESAFHKTITLLSTFDQLTNTYGFTWSAYEGLPVANYLIFGITGSGQAMQIGSVPGNSYFYNYPNPSASFVKYFVGFYTPACNSAKTDYIVRSNYVSSTTGIEDISTQTIHIFPNPATSQITISGIETGGTLRLYDLSGKLLLERENRDNTLKITGVAAGSYVLECVSESKNIVARGRVVVE